MPEPFHAIQALAEERARVIKELKDLNDLSLNEKRALTAEEMAKYDKLFARAEELRQIIERAHRQRELERQQLPAPGPDPAPAPGPDPAPQPAPSERRAPTAEIQRRWAALDAQARAVNRPRATAEYRQAFNGWVGGGHGGLRPEELRALQSDDQPSGGYLIVPVQLVAELIKDLDDAVFIRQWSRVFSVPMADSLGAPKRTAKLSSFVWAAELTQPVADAALKFGARNLRPHYLTGEIVVSNDLLRRAVMPGETIVRMELARDAGEVEERGFLTGNGANQPLGVFTASIDGISTSRDISSGNTTTAMTFDGLTNAKYGLKQAYHARARWMFHRDGVREIAKLKDGNGQYLWRESVRAGEPDRIINLPVFISEFAPNTFTTGLYVGILGDFQSYWIADALDIDIQRLVELEARKNQTVFVARLKTDGMPVLEEAFVRVKLA